MDTCPVPKGRGWGPETSGKVLHSVRGPAFAGCGNLVFGSWIKVLTLVSKSFARKQTVSCEFLGLERNLQKRILSMGSLLQMRFAVLSSYPE